MSRSTQFIGLTGDAAKYVENFKRMKSDRVTYGMFDEEIKLGKWEYNSIREKYPWQKDAVIREVVQASPWSSGPMIFTCLEVDIGNGAIYRIFEWVLDPTIEGQEVNFELGHYYV